MPSPWTLVRKDTFTYPKISWVLSFSIFVTAPYADKPIVISSEYRLLDWDVRR